jgi:microcystin degradation protein MlrC
MTSTRLEPAKSIYAQVPEVEALDGVLDAAIWVGYAWADEPRCKASVVVTGDDRDVITREAERLARSYWDGRAAFQFVAPTGTIEECLERALESSARPFFISDSGDNPTAGGAGDVTYTLTRLVGDPRITGTDVTTIFASVRDGEAVAAAKRAGVGQPITITAGARVDTTAPPVELNGVVHAIQDNDPRGGDIAVVRIGGLHVILTTKRKQFHEMSSYAALDLDPHTADIVVVKIGYLEPELYDAAADWLLALTPGGVDQDLLRLGHHRIERPMWPFDRDEHEPSLTATLI